MRTQAEKSHAFRELHRRPGVFVIPNPFDVGTARLLAHLGFEALATTSAGYAFSVGRRDSTIGRDEMLAHVGAIATATDLPVNADLEDCYGDNPKAVADTVRLAAVAGLAGCSIEDVTNRAQSMQVYDCRQAAERVRAAAEAAHALPIPFLLTARAENFIVGRPDIKDTIQRLQAYQDAGADVLFAPGLKTKEDITAVISSVDRPVNVIMGLQGVQLTVSELGQMGVKRISVGSALSRAALGAFLRAAREMRDHGTFSFAAEAVGYAEVSAMFEG